MGLDAPSWLRYTDWLIGNDWRAESYTGFPLVTEANLQTGEAEWWADLNGVLTRWTMEDGELFVLIRQPDGGSDKQPAPADVWKAGEDGAEIFWGIDTKGNAVKWVRGSGEPVWVLTKAGLRQEGDGPRQYIPLCKGLVRGDPGKSLQTSRPVAVTLFPRVRNTLILAGVAFLVVMPLALLLGIIAGINEGKWIDRVISISSLGATATPEFVTGVFLILVLGIWLKWLPAVSVFLSSDAIF